MTLNLASILESSASAFPDAPALLHGDLRLTYAELRARARAAAAHLSSLGVGPGDRVALLLPNRPTFTIAYFAALHAGGVAVPLSYLSVAREVAYVLRDSGARLLVAWKGFEAAARGGVAAAGAGTGLLLVDEARGPFSTVEGPAVDPKGDLDLAGTRPDDTAVILYTSGTTGEPKGAELTHFNMYSNCRFCGDGLFWRPGLHESGGPGQVFLASLPLFHSFGQTCVQNASLATGGAVAYLERFDAEAALDAMVRHGVTIFAGVPTMYFQLLRAVRAKPPSLRYCVSGGAAMPVDVMREFEERFGVQVLEGYGLSETSPVVSFSALWRPRKPGSIGRPIPGVEVRLVDVEDRDVIEGEVGELVVRGHAVMKGYLGRPEATREAMRGGWFHTGDMARRDADGDFYIVDRKKDMIIRGGFNVYPREVEEVLCGHPAVAEVAVVGIPDPEYGEEVKAFIALRPGASVTGAEVERFCRERLGAHKVPRKVEFLPSLPKGPTGKILRKELRAKKA